MFHAFTGLHCPGCGTFRATHQFLHGNFIGALDYNPLLVIFGYPLLGYLFINQLSILFRNKRMAGISISPAAAWATLAVVVIFTILRNIPAAPFNWLAP